MRATAGRRGRDYFENLYSAEPSVQQDSLPEYSPSPLDEDADDFEIVRYPELRPQLPSLNRG